MKFPYLALLIILLVSCAPSPKDEPDLAVYKITEIVDKDTGLPIKTNSLLITVEQEGKPEQLYTDQNITEYRIELPVGAAVRILVEAPGYEDWELVVRFKQAKYMEGPVEMTSIAGDQG